ncbi:hypothetical protein HOB10_05290 [Candidatus Parcubacteria bacterium]|jgi:hypothetical protein|nr:hypothetical protein [Candidatus Parcubacteria bacterium]
MKNLKYKFILLFALAPLVASAGPLESAGGLDQIAGQTGLIERPITDVIASIVRGLLAVLGTLFVVLIILGGFKWMTSQGNADRIKEAKESIKNATIGLVIVVTSYAIVRFVFDSLLKASTGNTPLNP